MSELEEAGRRKNEYIKELEEAGRRKDERIAKLEKAGRRKDEYINKLEEEGHQKDDEIECLHYELCRVKRTLDKKNLLIEDYSTRDQHVQWGVLAKAARFVLFPPLNRRAHSRSLLGHLGSYGGVFKEFLEVVSGLRNGNSHQWPNEDFLFRTVYEDMLDGFKSFCTAEYPNAFDPNIPLDLLSMDCIKNAIEEQVFEDKAEEFRKYGHHRTGTNSPEYACRSNSISGPAGRRSSFHEEHSHRNSFHDEGNRRRTIL